MTTETTTTATAPSRRPVLRAGAVFADRFVLWDELGRGGVATVYAAWDRTRLREVALKVWHPDSDLDAAVDRFGREVLLSSRVRHSGVVRPLDAGTWSGVLWLSMPVVNGETLRESVRQDRPSLDAGLQLAIEACDALEAVHAAGVLHRDVKTGNFLIDEQGALQLVDFGLARTLNHASRGTDSERVEGSPQYMPPERFAGRPEDERSDLYGLGAALYELFTGRLPHGGHDIAVICANVLTSTPRRLTAHAPQLPAALDDLVLSMLARRPDERPANAAQVRAALEAIRDSLTLRAA